MHVCVYQINIDIFRYVGQGINMFQGHDKYKFYKLYKFLS